MKRLEKLETFEETLKLYRRYIHVCCQRLNRDELFQDLVCEANIGLLKAYNEYDETRGTFHSIAVSEIRYAILNYLTNHSRTIRVPSNAQHSSLYKDDYNELTVISSSTQLYDDSDITIEDTIESDYYKNNYDNTNDVIKEVLSNYLSQLKPNYQTIIYKYFNEEKTLNKIGEELGISREAVRQQLDLALKKLRKLMKV